MNTDEWAIVFFAIVIIGGISAFMWYGGETVYVPLVKATLPFGVIQVEGDFVFGSGTISGEEIYYFKYWSSDGTLKSKSVPADECPIRIDGTFQLETNNFRSYFIAHIPRMPEVNQTWTTEWIK